MATQQLKRKAEKAHQYCDTGHFFQVLKDDIHNNMTPLYFFPFYPSTASFSCSQQIFAWLLRLFLAVLRTKNNCAPRLMEQWQLCFIWFKSASLFLLCAFYYLTNWDQRNPLIKALAFIYPLKSPQNSKHHTLMETSCDWKIHAPARALGKS